MEYMSKMSPVNKPVTVSRKVRAAREVTTVGRPLGFPVTDMTDFF